MGRSQCTHISLLSTCTSAPCTHTVHGVQAHISTVHTTSAPCMCTTAPYAQISTVHVHFSPVHTHHAVHCTHTSIQSTLHTSQRCCWRDGRGNTGAVPVVRAALVRERGAVIKRTRPVFNERRRSARCYAQQRKKICKPHQPLLLCTPQSHIYGLKSNYMRGARAGP